MTDPNQGQGSQDGGTGDGSTSGNTGDATGTNSGQAGGSGATGQNQGQGGTQGGTEGRYFTSKKDFEAEIKRQADERVERERKKHSRELEEAQAASEQTRLAEEKKWEELAESRRKELEGIKPRAGLAEEYEGALDTYLTKERAGLPASVISLLDQLPSKAKQLEWIANNKDEFVGSASGSATGTGQGQGQGQGGDQGQQGQQGSTEQTTRRLGIKERIAERTRRTGVDVMPRPSQDQVIDPDKARGDFNQDLRRKGLRGE